MSTNEENENNINNSKNEQSNEENKEDKTPRINQDENDNDNKSENDKRTNGENENEKEENNLFKEEAFIYLEKVNNEISIEEKTDNEFFNEKKGKFKYTICILQESNELYNSVLLKQTLLSIGENLKSLGKIKIEPMEIGIFIFINKFKEDNKLNIIKLFKDKEEKNNEYYIQEWLMNDDNAKEDLKKDLHNIKIFTINSFKYLSNIKSLSLYYDILRQIKTKKRIMFSSIMTAGVTFSEEKLLELISYSYHSKKKHGIATSSIGYKESNLMSKLCSYDTMRFNIYNLSYINESNAPFISSQLSLITLNDNLLKDLNEEYYKEKIDFRASIDYHDYNLALYLKEKNYLIKYINNNPGSIFTFDKFSFYDFQQIYINRFSGYYGNFFGILSSFNSVAPLQKIFLIFQIISICFEFILPTISTMIIFVIFYSAFKSYDYRVSLFFSLLYLSLMFVSGYCSIIGKNINQMRHTYFILNILMTFLYYLALICSIPAMHFAHEDKIPDSSGYEFDKAAISCIIIFTFIPYIIPLILNISSLGFVNFLLLFVYNLIFAPLIKINFNVAGVWGAPGVSGGNMVKERKSIFILLYLGINLFIGSLSFYNNDNKKKANCVMAFGIIYLIYNFIRTLAILFELCLNKEESFNNQSLFNNIIRDFENEENDEDIRSEEKKINEEENIDNDNNNQDNIREVEVEQNDD